VTSPVLELRRPDVGRQPLIEGCDIRRKPMMRSLAPGLPSQAPGGHCFQLVTPL